MRKGHREDALFDCRLRGLAFDCAGGDAFDVVTLQEHEQGGDWDANADAARGECREVVLVDVFAEHHVI